jgi:diguanylate cyclase (GGDEF)-like protein/PAS domain S-box-containing protein
MSDHTIGKASGQAGESGRTNSSGRNPGMQSDLPKTPLRALIVEDNPADAELLARTLRRSGFEPRYDVADTEKNYLACLSPAIDIVYCDYSMPRFDALRALQLLQDRHPEIPFIIVSGNIGEEIAVAAMRQGAWDYLLKDRLARIGEATRHALEKRRLVEAARQAEAALKASEQRLKAIVDNEPECVKIVSADGTLLDMNPAGLAMVEAKSRDEVVGRRVLDLIHAEDRENFLALHRRIMNGEAGMLQFRTVGLNGTIRWMETHSVPLRGSSEHIISVLSVTRDITAHKLVGERLRESEERFRQLAENIEDAFFLRSADQSEMLYVSPAYENIWGRNRQTLYRNPRSWGDAIHPEDRNRALQNLAAASASGRFDFEYRIVRPDGNLRWIRSRGFPIHDQAGKLVRIAGIATDITERKDAEAKISRLNRVYAVLSEINALIVRTRDRKELLNEACRIAVEKGGFAVAWIGQINRDTRNENPVAWAGEDAQHLATITIAGLHSRPPERQGLVAQAMREAKPAFTNDLATEFLDDAPRRSEAVRRGYRSFIVLPLLVSGEVIGNLSLMARQKNYFNDEELKLLTELAGDIAFALDYLEKAEKLDYLAYYDALTNLPNRTQFHHQLSHELHVAAINGTKVAVIVSDVKRFRLINETLGRHAGDALLRDLANRYKAIWPETGSLSRIAADCLAGIVTNVEGETEIARLLKKVFAEVFASPFALEEKELNVTATMGIAISPADGQNADTLFQNAEAALKRAKAAGEHYLFYQREMNAAVAETLLLENKMRRALDRGQFMLHYQPKATLASGEISGLEALIRWNDPETGLVSPDRFIPILEETGMISEVGKWAIAQALADYRVWYKNGLVPPRVAVNVSAVQLRQRNFVTLIRDSLRESGIGAHGLDLEITESVVMDDIQRNIDKLREIRDMGVNIAVDDFGTGYSSLGYLTKLPVNALKIDRSFIVNMAQNPDSMSIVSTTISLAHSLNLKVIAEGVETEEQAHFLKLLRCDEIQGFLVSRPVPAAEIGALLAARRQRS